MSAKQKKLTKLFDSLPITTFDPERDKYVIFSDQHIGMAEFDLNKDLYLKALEYYYNSDYAMIAVGDYEELHRYGIKELKLKYPEVYAKEQEFLKKGRYIRIFGNHDIDWKKQSRVRKHLHDVMPGLEIVEGVKFNWNGYFIFLAHGHQGDFINDTMGIAGRIILRYLARPFGLSSFTSPAKRYVIRKKDETVYYDWAKDKKVLFIAGHTHRPMFESLTQLDRIRIKIENMLRKCCGISDAAEKRRIEEEIIRDKSEYETVRKAEGEETKWTTLGQIDLLMPCYCNDGSCLHENGITCIELNKNKISLIFLYDNTRKANIDKHLRAPTRDLIPNDPNAKHYKKQILEEEDLGYIFTRIRLLG